MVHRAQAQGVEGYILGAVPAWRLPPFEQMRVQRHAPVSAAAVRRHASVWFLVLWCHSACLRCLLRWSPCRRCCSTCCRGAPVTHGGGWRPVACVSWRADATRCAELRRGARAARGRHAEQPGRAAARGPGRGPPLAGRRGGRLQRAGPTRMAAWPSRRRAAARGQAPGRSQGTPLRQRARGGCGEPAAAPRAALPGSGLARACGLLMCAPGRSSRGAAARAVLRRAPWPHLHRGWSEEGLRAVPEGAWP